MDARLPLWTRLRRRPLYAVAVVAAVAFAGWAFRPRPVPVDVAVVAARDVVVAFTEEGRTRVRERYAVAAPLPGTLERIELEPGDTVAAGQTVATLRASRAALLDAAVRERAQATLAQARDDAVAADAALSASRARLRERELARARLMRLAAQQLVAAADLDAVRAQVAQSVADVRAASARVAATRSGERAARAVLALEGGAGTVQLPVPSPAAGHVLRRFVESEAPVQAGQPLLEVGDLRDLEAVVDVLSADAVRLRPGVPVQVVDWGGEPIAATVARIEPGAFLKVSALGVDEQRVPVIVRFDRPPPAALGDGFRIGARFLVWRGRVPAVPAAALFRDDGAWAVYVVEAGRARLRRVQVGHAGEDRVEVRAGLHDGARVIVYPDDAVRDGVRVAATATAER